MLRSRPFIPNDKPRSWVIAVCSGLCGLAVGLVAFVAAFAKLQLLKSLALIAFVSCWVVLALSGLSFLVGLLSGRYRRVEARPWSEQVW